MDERYFDDDATMRLVARERAALGVEAPSAKWTSAALSELAYGYHEDVPPERSGATVVVHLSANPTSGLIPGAVVTLACALVNDGAAAARDVAIVVPLPEGARYVPGSGKRDGTAESDADAGALLGEGRLLGTLAPNQRTTLVVMLAVEPGLAPLVVSASITAKSGAVVGARSLRLLRSTAPSAFAAALSTSDAAPAAIEAPFYELEPEEELVYEAADAAMSSVVARPRSAFAAMAAAAAAAMPDVAPPAVGGAPSSQAVPAPAPQPHAAPNATDSTPQPDAVADGAAAPLLPQPEAPAPRPRTKPSEAAAPHPLTAPPEAAPPPIAPPSVPAEAAVDSVALAAPPAAEPPRAGPLTFNVGLNGGALFSVRLPRTRLTFLAQLFVPSKSLGMLAHYLLLNALAAVDPLPDAGDDSLARFATAQEQRLSRAVIAKRLGKSLVAEDVAAPLPTQFPPKMQPSESVDLPTARDGGAIVLYRIMRPNELSFLSASVNNANATPFMRASQLFVGMCGHNAVANGEARRADLATALRDYSAACASEINRLFVRARLAKKIDLFDAAPAQLDRQAAALIALLERPA